MISFEDRKFKRTLEAIGNNNRRTSRNKKLKKSKEFHVLNRTRCLNKSTQCLEETITDDSDENENYPRVSKNQLQICKAQELSDCVNIPCESDYQKWEYSLRTMKSSTLYKKNNLSEAKSSSPALFPITSNQIGFQSEDLSRTDLNSVIEISNSKYSLSNQIDDDDNQTFTFLSNTFENNDLITFTQFMHKEIRSERKYKIRCKPGGYLEKFNAILEKQKAENQFWAHENCITTNNENINGIIENIQTIYGRTCIRLTLDNGDNILTFIDLDQCVKHGLKVGSVVTISLENQVYVVQNHIFRIPMKRIAVKE